MKTLRPYLIWFAAAILLTIGAIFGMQWARDHPQHFPGAHVAMTAAVAALIQKAIDHPDHGNDWRGVWHGCPLYVTSSPSEILSGRAPVQGAQLKAIKLA